MMVKLRFTEEIPEFVGIDEKTYGPFKPDDVAEIPLENAVPLVASKWAVVSKDWIKEKILELGSKEKFVEWLKSEYDKVEVPNKPTFDDFVVPATINNAEKELKEIYNPELYFTRDASSPKFNANLLAENIRSLIPFVTLADTDETYWYDRNEGIWKPNGEAKIKSLVREILGEFATTHYVNETVAAVKQTTYIDRNKFDSLPLEEIPVANGILNWKTKELRPYKPEDYVTQKLPVIYDPNAKTEEFNKFLHEILANEEDVQVVKEMFAYCLYRDYPLQKAFMLVGDGSNGKSTLLQVLAAFLGKENISSVALQDLSKNRFAPAQLYRKLANIYADLPAAALKDAGKFKILTGGDWVTAEKKFKNHFQFKNYAKLIFSANQVPYVEDQTDAFYRRWIIINFPFKFVDNPTGPNEKPKDEHLLDKLTTQQELSGILNECLEILPKLLENGFSYKKTTEEIRQQYLRAASPVAAFVMDCIVEDPDSFIPKDELYNAYCEFCRNNNLPIKSSNSFHKELRKYVSVYEERRKVGTERKRVYVGIKLVQCVQDVQVDDNLKVSNNSHNLLNIEEPGHPGQGGHKFVFIEPYYGRCSYCGEMKELRWKDEEGNHLCDDCRREMENG